MNNNFINTVSLDELIFFKNNKQTNVYKLITNTKNINNIQQSGGKDKRISITFMYRKNYKLDDDTDLYIKENFNKLFIVLDDFSAYEMKQHILNDYYSITLILKENELFRFKFMRDSHLEFLDQDPILKTRYGELPNTDPDYDNVNSWKTRWRWIYPKTIDNKQIYFFSFYVPKFNDIIENKDSNITFNDFNENNTNEKISKNFKIQASTKPIILKQISGNIREEISLNEVDIGNVDDMNSPNNLLLNILRHNLGYDTSAEEVYVGQKNVIEIMNTYHQSGCRNENLLEYIDNKIIKNIDILTAQLEFIESTIADFLSINETTIGPGPGPGPTYYLQLRDKLDNGALTNKPGYINDTVPRHDTLDIYFYDQMVYYSEITNTLHEYNVNISGLDIKLKINIEMKTNPLINKISSIFDAFQNKLFNVTSNVFNSFPMSLLEYNEFILNYIKTCKLYYDKWLVFNILWKIYTRQHIFILNTNPTAAFNLEINGENITLAELKSPSVPIPGPDKKSNLLFKLKTNILDKFNNCFHDDLTDLTIVGKKIFHMNTNCLYNPDTKGFFNNINKTFLFNLYWIDKYIGDLRYQYTKVATTFGLVYPSYSYTPDITRVGPIIQLKEVIENNTKDGTFYMFIKSLYDYCNDDISMNNFNSTNYTKTLSSDGELNTIESELSKKVYSINNNVNKTDIQDQAINKLTESTVPLFVLTKIKKIDNTINLDTTNKISQALSIYEPQIRSFARSFWINLTEISIDAFLDSLTHINMVKLYYKLLFIVSLLTSNKSGTLKLKDDSGILKINNNTYNISDRSSLDFYELINYNDTFKKLLQISRHFVIRGELTLKTSERLLKNKYFDIYEPVVKIINIDALGDDTSFDNAIKFKAINFQIISGNSKQLNNVVGLVLGAVINPTVITIVDSLHKKLMKDSDVLGNIPSTELEY